jgi:RHS repeat-associated protein
MATVPHNFRRTLTVAILSLSFLASPELPRPIAKAAQPQEIVELRTRDSKTLKNADGKRTTIFGRHLHYEAAPNRWEPIDLRFRSQGSDWLSDRNVVVVRASPGSISAADHVRGKGIRWEVPGAWTISGTTASFEDAAGRGWTYRVTKTGIKLNGTVRSHLGKGTFTFRYSLLGGAAPLELDTEGNLRSDSFVIPRPVIYGAHGEIYLGPPWRIASSEEIAIDFDDSEIPDRAFPYEVDPTTIFTSTDGTDDGYVEREGTTYPPGGSVHNNPASTGVFIERSSFVDKINGPSFMVRNGLVRWNTANLPDDATVVSANLRVYVSSVEDANSRQLTADWYPASSWPIDNSDWIADAQTGALSGKDLGELTAALQNEIPLQTETNVSRVGYTALRLHVSGGEPDGKNQLVIASSEHTTLPEPQLVVTWSSPPPPPPSSTSFPPTGQGPGTYSWQVPAGVTAIRVKAWGAQGGYPIVANEPPGYSGPGGYVEATLAVVPLETLQINVGGKAANAVGGFNGGGSGWFPDGNGVGGGGASDVRRDGQDAGTTYELEERLVVAGGGGGSGAGATSTRGMGGSGGGLVGGSGEQPSGLTGGGGGTQSAGGIGSGNLPNAALGTGGRGGDSGGGGGGGGLYGGGGGNAGGGGGGGGSSYVTPEASDAVLKQGIWLGDGKIEISFPPTDDELPSSPTGSQTFAFSGKSTWWQVPGGVSAIRVEAWGAQGGNQFGGVRGYGGLGGHVEATVPVSSDEWLLINVGGMGSQAGSGASGAGYNGGGSGREDGWGGGGASDVRRGGVTFANRVLVAGGGGGAGSAATPVHGAGGSGGALVGRTGEKSSCDAPGGAGGTQSAGGTGGPGSNDLTTQGRWGIGGQGGDFNADGGGGGGGYYGGGGGSATCGGAGTAAAGGGGGSSFSAADVTGVLHETGVHDGNGLIKISYPPAVQAVPSPPPAASASFSYTGAPQWWTVPDGVRAIRVMAKGAQGGSAGGEGGSIDAVLDVVPGEVLQINVGGQGAKPAGGFGGGGTGRENGWGGGGLSDLRRSGVTLADRVVVAAGGGGQGGYHPEPGSGAAGGVGGDLVGGSGGSACANESGGGPGGSGGTQSAGGAGTSGDASTNGKFVLGGRGGDYNADGGGGGAGYYGGGGGSACGLGEGAGGGGGSNWVDATRAYVISRSAGGRQGNGLVTIEWPFIFPIDSTFGIDSYGEYIGNVHLGSGNYVESITDVEIATVGPDLELTRTYNSLDTRVGAFGKGWSWNYDIRAEQVGSDVTIVYPDGRREKHIGNAGTFAAPRGFVSTLTNEIGGGWRLTHKDKTVHVFGSDGKLVAVRDAYGRQLLFNYTLGQLTRVTDATSLRYIDFSYTGTKITSATTTPITGAGYSELRWNFVYQVDLLKKVCDARDPNTLSGVCSTYDYALDRLTKITRPLGNTAVSLTYRADGKVATSKNGAGDLISFAYGPGVTQVTDGRGFVSSYFFDALYRTTRVINPLGSATIYEYDGNGFRSGVVDANGNRVALTYDARGNLTSQTNGKSETTWFTYVGDDLIARRDGRATGPTDVNYKTSFSYNAQGDVLTETSPAATDYPSGVVKATTYTAGTEIFDPGWGASPPGLKRSESPGKGTTWFEYDSKGDLRRRTDPTGLKTEFAYDEIGRPTSITLKWGTSGSATTYRAYDQLGRILQETEPAAVNVIDSVIHQRRTAYSYDANGNRTGLGLSDVGVSPSPKLRETTYYYDKADRLWRILDAEGGFSTRAFDRNGNVVRTADALGRTYEAIYDAANRPVEIRLLSFVDDPVAVSAPRDLVLKRYRYDAAGRRVVEAGPQPGTGGLSEQDGPGAMSERWTTFDAADRIESVRLMYFDNRPGINPATRDIVLAAYTYDGAGNALSESNGDADTSSPGYRVVNHVYDQSGRRQSSTLELGATDRVTEFHYDELGNVIRRSVCDSTVPVCSGTAAAAETRSSFDNAGRLIEEIVENGTTDLVSTFGYDERGLRWMIDPRGDPNGPNPDTFKTEFSLDELGRRYRITGPARATESGGSTPSSIRPTETVGFDTLGNVVATQDQRGLLTRKGYDRLDRLTRIDHPSYTPPDGSPVVAAFETYTYDKVGNLTSARDRRGRVTDFTFDARNRAIRQLDPLISGQPARGTIRYQYDDAGNRTAIIDQTGARTEFEFDDLGRLRFQTAVVTQEEPDARFRAILDYDDLGNNTYTCDRANSTFACDPAGVAVAHAYNAASERTQTTDELGKMTIYRYDAAGRLTSTEDPLSRSILNRYDEAGRKTSIEYRTGVSGPLLATEYATYDSAGNQTAVRSARSISATDDSYRTAYTYDAAHQLTSVVEPGDGVTPVTTTFGYDVAGNITRVTDGRGNRTIYTWNPWNLREATIEPSTPGQDAPVDRQFVTTYDAGGMPIKDTIPGTAVPSVGGTPITITRTFDELGRLVTEAGTGASTPVATRTFGYDLAGRLTSWSHPSGTVTAAYDDRGLLLSTTVPGGSSIASSFRYDAAGRMTQRTDSAGTTTFTYDASRGQLDTLADPITGRTLDVDWNDASQPDHVTYAGTGVTRTWTYDDRGRPASDTLAAGATNRHKLEYEYEKDGDLKFQKITVGTGPTAVHEYRYDPSGRLTKWIKPNASDVAYSYDAANNRTQAGGATYTYDARNRLTNDGTKEYSWTPRGTLASVKASGITTTVIYDALNRLTSFGSASYTYDALNRAGTRGSESFTYAGRELDPVAHGTFAYGRTPAGDLTSLKSGTTARLAGLNRHGDLAWLMDTSAAVTDTRTYEPHGGVFAQTGSTASALGFQADYTDPTSGLVWMGTRWYDPANATFASRDNVFGQLRTPVSLNRYTYANADPLSFFDADGQWPSWLDAAASAVWSGIQAVGSAIYNYVIQPIVSTVSAGAQAILSIASTAYRTARRAAYTTAQRIAQTTRLIAARLAAQARARLDRIRTAAAAVGLGIAKEARAALGAARHGAEVLGAGIGAAAKGIYGCFDSIHSTCTQIAAGAAAGLAVAGLCATGVGCAIAAGFAGGAVSGAIGCGQGESVARCTLIGGALGGATAGVVYGGSVLLRSALGRAPSIIGRGASRAGSLVDDVSDDFERSLAPRTAMRVADDVVGARQVTVLGRYSGGTDAFVGKPGFNVLDLPSKGTGRWYWSRNRAFIDDAITRGDDIRLVTNPFEPLYSGGNVFQRELRYLKDLGYGFEEAGDYWRAVPGR